MRGLELAHPVGELVPQGIDLGLRTRPAQPSLKLGGEAAQRLPAALGQTLGPGQLATNLLDCRHAAPVPT